MTPEPNAASVALIEGQRVFLIQRAFDPLRGLWTFPGGRREAGETIEETAIREVQEELGLVLADLLPVMAFPISGGYHLQVFATRAFMGAITPSPEVADYGWFLPEAIAGRPTTPALAEVVARAFAAVGPG
ncbi:MAG: NUDIX hydrolase [Devosia sp.]